MYIKAFVFLILIALLSSCTHDEVSDRVSTSGRKILVNDEPYLIKGVCYHPVPKGSEKRSFENLDQDLALMKEAGINTIRVYSPIDDEDVMDKIHQAGIKIIVGFGYNQEGFFDMLSGSFINYIKQYRKHPAILFWELGNEYNYHPEWFEGDMKNWYRALNDAAKLVHQTDSLHPVATAHGELPDSLARAMCPAIDIWGMNVYRWDNPEPIFGQWKDVSIKPMYLSEAGSDSYMTIEKLGYQRGENQRAQADATQNILDAVFRNQEICSGVTVFAFVDEYWKAGNSDKQDTGGWAPNSTGVPYDGAPNEEYWGIVKIDRTTKQVYSIIKANYLKH